jgi:hypothetical protein
MEMQGKSVGWERLRPRWGSRQDFGAFSKKQLTRGVVGTWRVIAVYSTDCAKAELAKQNPALRRGLGNS